MQQAVWIERRTGRAVTACLLGPDDTWDMLPDWLKGEEVSKVLCQGRPIPALAFARYLDAQTLVVLPVEIFRQEFESSAGRALIPFDFRPDEPVMIKDINRPGIVKGLSLDGRGKTYSVHFWIDGKRYQEWLFAEEIAPLKPAEGTAP